MKKESNAEKQQKWLVEITIFTSSLSFDDLVPKKMNYDRPAGPWSIWSSFLFS